MNYPQSIPNMANRTGIQSLAIHACVIMLLLTTIVFTDSSTTPAQTASAIPRECRAAFKTWQKKDGYGAFAASKNGSCGQSWKSSTIDEARQLALAWCQKRSKNCKIVAEITKPSECEDIKTPAAKRIEACTERIARSSKNKSELAHYYTLRAYGYQQQGNHDAARNDYDKAIRIYPKFEAAYFNRGKLRMSMGDYAGALVDFKLSLKLSKIKHEWYGSTKVLITDLEKRIKWYGSLDNAKLCAAALNASKRYWDLDIGSSSKLAVAEVEKRKLSIGDCRAAIGLPREPPLEASDKVAPDTSPHSLPQ